MRQSDFYETLHKIRYVTNLTTLIIQLHDMNYRRHIKKKTATYTQVHERDSNLTFFDNGVS